MWLTKCGNIVLVFLFLLLSNSVSWADEDAVKKYKDFLPDQIQALPEEIVRTTLPMMYSLAARKGLSVEAPLVFAMELNTLMYPGLSNYQQAVKSFQADLREKPTGNLTVWQIHELQKRSEFQRLGAIGFPFTHTSQIVENSARVEGTVKILEEKHAWPVNHVEINCYKSDAYCEYRQLAIAFPTDNSWTQTYSVLDLGTDLYKITHWANGVIDAVPLNEGACRINSLKLNFNTKEFFEIASNSARKCDVLGSTLDKLSKPRISQILDGSEIINSEFAALRKKSYLFLASDFRKRVDELTTKQAQRQ